MIFPEYAWITSVGFFFTLGVVYAVIMIKLLWTLLSWLLDKAIGKPPKLVVPPYVTELKVVRTGMYVHTSARAYGQYYTHGELVASHDSVIAASIAAQVKLLKIIAEDHSGKPSN